MEESVLGLRTLPWNRKIQTDSMQSDCKKTQKMSLPLGIYAKEMK